MGEALNHCELGDCRDIMRRWIADDVRVNCVVTSPPYWGLRDYGVEGQLGLEALHDCLGWATGERCGECHVCHMVEVFSLVRDLLADDGTLWLNYGDTYAGGAGGRGDGGFVGPHGKTSKKHDGKRIRRGASGNRGNVGSDFDGPNRLCHVPAKNLIGIPWRVAFALQVDGWYLRQDIIWAKPNPMPESVGDRCTKSHEYVFLLAKSPRYYFDAEAIAEPIAKSSVAQLAQNIDRQAGSARVPGKTNGPMKAVMPRFGGDKYGDDNRAESRTKSGNEWAPKSAKRNHRSVWTIATQPFKEAHFATFPPALVELCVLAGSRPGDVVFDPFMGSGTVAAVAERLGRQWLGCELNDEYLPMQAARRPPTGGLAL